MINIPKHDEREELTNDYLIRRSAVDFGVPLITNIQLAKRIAEAFAKKRPEDLVPRAWQDYV